MRFKGTEDYKQTIDITFELARTACRVGRYTFLRYKQKIDPVLGQDQRMVILGHARICDVVLDIDVNYLIHLKVGHKK